MPGVPSMLSLRVKLVSVLKGVCKQVTQMIVCVHCCTQHSATSTQHAFDNCVVVHLVEGFGM
jgi:hypothetical protein